MFSTCPFSCCWRARFDFGSSATPRSRPATASATSAMRSSWNPSLGPKSFAIANSIQAIQPALLVTSWPVRHWMGGTTPASMQLSAQLATTLAAILLVFPLYFLGRELFNPKIAFWGAALFQCLPATARATADGLSEGVYFLFAVTAIWLAARALRTNSLVQFVLCGLACGLAYLTRPEGALIRGCCWNRALRFASSARVPAFLVEGSHLQLLPRLDGSNCRQSLLSGNGEVHSEVFCPVQSWAARNQQFLPTGEVGQKLDSEHAEFGPGLMASGSEEGARDRPTVGDLSLHPRFEMIAEFGRSRQSASR